MRFMQEAVQSLIFEVPRVLRAIRRNSLCGVPTSKRGIIAEVRKRWTVQGLQMNATRSHLYADLYRTYYLENVSPCSTTMPIYADPRGRDIGIIDNFQAC